MRAKVHWFLPRKTDMTPSILTNHVPIFFDDPNCPHHFSEIAEPVAAFWPRRPARHRRPGLPMVPGCDNFKLVTVTFAFTNSAGARAVLSQSGPRPPAVPGPAPAGPGPGPGRPGCVTRRHHQWIIQHADPTSWAGTG